MKTYTVEELFNIDKDENNQEVFLKEDVIAHLQAIVDTVSNNQDDLNNIAIDQFIEFINNGNTKVTIQLISSDRRSDMLTGALEGGSNGWYFIGEDAEVIIAQFVPDFAKERKRTPFCDLLWQAITAGAVVPVRDCEDEETVLGHISLQSIKEGEELLQKNQPDHFNDIIEENDDATTADVWFQYAVLKEIVYVADYGIPEFTIGLKTKGIPMMERFKITSSLDCNKLIRSVFDADKIEWVEEFVVICLNRANRPIGTYKVSQGGVSGTVADPKVIFQTALLCNASAIIVGHNHPSGNCTASQADIDLTKKLKEAGKFLELQLIDHIIVMPNGTYFSFADEGLI